MNSKNWIASVFIMLVVAGIAIAQPKDDVTSWKVNYDKKDVCVGDEINIVYEIDLKGKWHLYGATFDANLGPITFNYLEKPSVTGLEVLGGMVDTEKPKYDDLWMGDIIEYHGKAIIKQPVKITDPQYSFSVKIEYQVCEEGLCLNFDKVVTVRGTAKDCKASDGGTKPQVENKEPNQTDLGKIESKQANFSGDELEKTTGGGETEGGTNCVCCDSLNKSNTGLKEDLDKIKGALGINAGSGGGDQGCEMPRRAGWTDIEIIRFEEDKKEELDLVALLFFFGFAFVAGFTALLTPCVFPMIPMTVSFFTKSGGSKAKAISQALLYGFFIIFIYTVFGVVVAKINGPGFANYLSVHWLPNGLFFIIFVLFALSFLGLFEITLPHSLVNKVDRQADKGGFIGVFFMAFTLVLVSFSCTGPIVGTILVESAGGSWAKPIAGMLGFSLAFAIPFTLFAIFPSMLESLPKSGGWLNSVKVVLGLAELALALKFFSQIDLIQNWGLLDREVFLSLWIAIFGVMALYLLGKLRLPHDSPMEKIGVFRLFVSILTLSFVVYMIPGLWGAPLKSLSGLLPPMESQDFDIERINREVSGQESYLCEEPMYADDFHLPHGLEGYFDFRQAICCARAQSKPIFIDFTGRGCANCRMVESNVWSDPEVKDMLKNDFVMAALYGDYNKASIPKDEQYTNSEGETISTVGKLNTDLLYDKFGLNGQPKYLFLAFDEEMSTDTKIVLRELQPVADYDTDLGSYKEYLRKAIENYKEMQKPGFRQFSNNE